jgi:3-methyladenine DNA glycosylase/8-oxoguanine DNA glycosylase
MPSRSLCPSQPIDLIRTLAPLRHGGGDPTVKIDARGIWRTTHTPVGPATMHLSTLGDSIDVEAWGPGAEWVLEMAPELIGCGDDPRSFSPRQPVLRALHRRMPGVRIPRSKAVVEALVPFVIEQKITGAEAHRAYRRMVLKWGDRAPGPRELRLPVEPGRLAATPYFAFHPFGIERKRAETLRRACMRAARLEEAANMSPSDGRNRLMLIQGVGPWTAGEVARTAFGDADAVPVGDYHLPHLVTWVLTGRPRGNDSMMLELLDEYRGHRARVLRLIELSGMRPPRRGPRRPIRSIERI